MRTAQETQAPAGAQEDPDWRKKLKMKSATPLKLGLCLDPRTVDECMDLESKKGRMWRVMRAKQMQQAHHRDREKFDAWRTRIEHFYKRATWGAAPTTDEAVQRVHAKRSGLKGAEEEASLPSKTLWHYYYHGGKTRAERRAEAAVRIAEMRREQEAKLEARKEAHRERLAQFAKRGLARRDQLAQRRKEQQKHLRPPVLLPLNPAEKAAQEEQATVEKEARTEAATQIQAVVRGGLARAQTRPQLTHRMLEPQSVSEPLPEADEPGSPTEQPHSAKEKPQPATGDVEPQPATEDTAVFTTAKTDEVLSPQTADGAEKPQTPNEPQD